MTKSYSENNLFTAFNNIESIKQANQERKLKPVIRVEEMIKTIKEHYNLNAPMLAENLGVDVQAIYRWEKGGRPNIKRYNKIKELYEGIVPKEETEALEQPKIANKEVKEDITAGTPFIVVTNEFDNKEVYLNVYEIREIREIRTSNNGTHIYTDSNTIVKEKPAEVLELIRKKLKENGEN